MSRPPASGSPCGGRQTRAGEPDPVLAGDHEPPPLFGGEVALAGAPDVRSDEMEGLLPAKQGNNARAVIAHNQSGATSKTPALDDDATRLRVDRVLHKLRHRLCGGRIGNARASG